MRTSELLHFAFRANDPGALGDWYARLFDGQYVIHPVMSALDIVLIKLGHPEAVFHGLMEIWPRDVIWDGEIAAFRRIEAGPTPLSYGHVALKIAADADAVIAELQRRGVPCRLEPRGPGLRIPVIEDPEGNMIELFPNVDHIDVPPEAFCSPDRAAQAIAAVKARFEREFGPLRPGDAVPLLLFSPPAAM